MWRNNFQKKKIYITRYPLTAGNVELAGCRARLKRIPASRRTNRTGGRRYVYHLRVLMPSACCRRRVTSRILHRTYNHRNRTRTDGLYSNTRLHFYLLVWLQVHCLRKFVNFFLENVFNWSSMNKTWSGMIIIYLYV